MYGCNQCRFLVRGDPGETVVRRIAEDHQDRLASLDGRRAFGLFLQLGEEQRALRLFGRLPAGQGVGQKDLEPLAGGQRWPSERRNTPS